MKYFLFFFCMTTALNAQQAVTGRKTDAVNGDPIPYAAVMIANTTIGAVSDADGVYRITATGSGSFEIAVSHVGYKPAFHKVDAPQPYRQVDFALEYNEIPEIFVTPAKTYNQRDVDLFWNKLLGVKPSRRGLEALNPEKVYFYKTGDGVLKAFCDEPVEVVNHETGYHIRYMLASFEHDYRDESTTIYGLPHFTELKPQDERQKNRWARKRKSVYDVSLTRFLRALYRDQIHEEGFVLIEKDSVRHRKSAFILSDILKVHQAEIQMTIETPLYLACVSKPATDRMINNSYANIFRSGIRYPILVLLPQEITVYSDGSYTGAMQVQEINHSVQGLSSKIPLEYATAQNRPANIFGTESGVAGDEQGFRNEINRLYSHIQAFNDFSTHNPQEKVYLHFDNTSYYQGDNIWFKCYVVNGRHQLGALSKTLYVELLNPNGKVVDKRILKIEDGQCHGDFSLNQLPFYSGFYEVRAYTKYMLNFGDDAFFSRLLPVYDKPETEGAYEEKVMQQYGRHGTGAYPMNRERPLLEKNVNVRFYPEGGYLIKGLASRVAFEATDETGRPVSLTGTVRQWRMENE
jgi:hypothetical protein